MRTGRSYKEVTLVMIDDDDVDFMAFERALKELRIVNPIVRARNGREGLALLRDPTAVPRPYIVLLDINMPQMSGLEMLTQVRADPSLRNAVIFVLTTSKSDEDRIAAYRNHIAGYIVKDQIEANFLDIVEMLDSYWRVVALPDE